MIALFHLHLIYSVNLKNYRKKEIEVIIFAILNYKCKDEITIFQQKPAPNNLKQFSKLIIRLCFLAKDLYISL